MKSVTNIMVIASASVLAAIGIFSFSLTSQINTITRDANERIISEGVTDIEFIKKSLDQSLTYSTYQSSYEILKYGEYRTECNPHEFKNLPYWRAYTTNCAPSSLDGNLREKSSDVFGEYLVQLKEKGEKINIQLPEHVSVSLQTQNDMVSVGATSDEKLTFTSKNLVVSDSLNTNKNLSLKVGNLIEKGREVANVQIIKDKITPVKQQIPSECKQINYSQCYNPRDDPNRALNDERKTKEQLLSVNCSAVLGNLTRDIKVEINREDIGSLNERYDSGTIDVSFDIDIPGIRGNVDTDDENCDEGPIVNHTDCSCIRWICSHDNSRVKLDLSDATPLTSDDTCVDCLDNNAAGNCVKNFETKRCPTWRSGVIEIDGQCYESVDRVCPTTGCCGSDCYVAPQTYYNYHNDTHVRERLVTKNNGGCNDEPGNIVRGRPANPSECQRVCPENTIERNSICYRSTSRRECPPEAPNEITVNGQARCYKNPDENTMCDLYENLYTKNCTYNYWANANVLVNINDTDTSRLYPVYDPVEKATKLKNLELNFYILDGDVIPIVSTHPETVGSGLLQIPETYREIFINAEVSEGTSASLIAAIFKCGEHASDSCPGPNCKTDNPQEELSRQWPDSNSQWARSGVGATGPFQFVGCTWAGGRHTSCNRNGWAWSGEFETNPATILRFGGHGRDGDGDGISDVQNLKDAAFGASAYLNACRSYTYDATKPLQWNQAHCYNHDRTYADKVYNCFQHLSQQVFLLQNQQPPISSVTGCDYIWPLRKDTTVLQCFPTYSFGGRHDGIDIPDTLSNSVFASKAGNAVYVFKGCTVNHFLNYIPRDRCGGGWGNHIIIRHDDGLFSAYAHLTEIFVNVGNTVLQGDVIGKVGSTGQSSGPHLHFELRTQQQGGFINPCNNKLPCELNCRKIDRCRLDVV